jgi:hypothetical protein
MDGKTGGEEGRDGPGKVTPTEGHFDHHHWPVVIQALREIGIRLKYTRIV